MFGAFKKNTTRDFSSLKETVKELEELESRLGKLQKNFQDLHKRMEKAVTKVGMVRFNPFRELGSDQSFSLALLDKENNGFVLTSHYLQETNRVYAKPLKQGKSEYPLSQEEQEAIEKAITNN